MARTLSMATELSMSMTMDGSDLGWVRGWEEWRSLGTENSRGLRPGTMNPEGSMGGKDMVAVAKGGEGGGADKVGSEDDILLF